MVGNTAQAIQQEVNSIQRLGKAGQFTKTAQLIEKEIILDSDRKDPILLGNFFKVLKDNSRFRKIITDQQYDALISQLDFANTSHCEALLNLLEDSRTLRERFAKVWEESELANAAQWQKSLAKKLGQLLYTKTFDDNLNKKYEKTFDVFGFKSLGVYEIQANPGDEDASNIYESFQLKVQRIMLTKKDALIDSGLTSSAAYLFASGYVTSGTTINKNRNANNSRSYLRSSGSSSGYDANNNSSGNNSHKSMAANGSARMLKRRSFDGNDKGASEIKDSEYNTTYNLAKLFFSRRVNPKLEAALNRVPEVCADLHSPIIKPTDPQRANLAKNFTALLKLSNDPIEFTKKHGKNISDEGLADAAEYLASRDSTLYSKWADIKLGFRDTIKKRVSTWLHKTTQVLSEFGTQLDSPVQAQITDKLLSTSTILKNIELTTDEIVQIHNQSNPINLNGLLRIISDTKSANLAFTFYQKEREVSELLTCNPYFIPLLTTDEKIHQDNKNPLVQFLLLDFNDGKEIKFKGLSLLNSQALLETEFENIQNRILMLLNVDKRLYADFISHLLTECKQKITLEPLYKLLASQNSINTDSTDKQILKERIAVDFLSGLFLEFKGREKEVAKLILESLNSEISIKPNVQLKTILKESCSTMAKYALSYLAPEAEGNNNNNATENINNDAISRLSLLANYSTVFKSVTSQLEKFVEKFTEADLALFFAQKSKEGVAGEDTLASMFKGNAGDILSAISANIISSYQPIFDAIFSAAFLKELSSCEHFKAVLSNKHLLTYILEKFSIQELIELAKAEQENFLLFDAIFENDVIIEKLADATIANDAIFFENVMRKQGVDKILQSKGFSKFVNHKELFSLFLDIADDQQKIKIAEKIVLSPAIADRSQVFASQIAFSKYTLSRFDQWTRTGEQTSDKWLFDMQQAGLLAVLPMGENGTADTNTFYTANKKAISDWFNNENFSAREAEKSSHLILLLLEESVDSREVNNTVAQLTREHLLKKFFIGTVLAKPYEEFFKKNKHLFFSRNILSADLLADNSSLFIELIDSGALSTGEYIEILTVEGNAVKNKLIETVKGATKAKLVGNIIDLAKILNAESCTAAVIDSLKKQIDGHEYNKYFIELLSTTAFVKLLMVGLTDLVQKMVENRPDMFAEILNSSSVTVAMMQNYQNKQFFAEAVKYVASSAGSSSTLSDSVLQKIVACGLPEFEQHIFSNKALCIHLAKIGHRLSNHQKDIMFSSLLSQTDIDACISDPSLNDYVNTMFSYALTKIEEKSEIWSKLLVEKATPIVQERVRFLLDSIALVNLAKLNQAEILPIIFPNPLPTTPLYFRFEADAKQKLQILTILGTRWEFLDFLASHDDLRKNVFVGLLQADLAEFVENLLAMPIDKDVKVNSLAIINAILKAVDLRVISSEKGQEIFKKNSLFAKNVLADSDLIKRFGITGAILAEVHDEELSKAILSAEGIVIRDMSAEEGANVFNRNPYFANYVLNSSALRAKFNVNFESLYELLAQPNNNADFRKLIFNNLSEEGAQFVQKAIAFAPRQDIKQMLPAIQEAQIEVIERSSDQKAQRAVQEFIKANQNNAFNAASFRIFASKHPDYIRANYFGTDILIGNDVEMSPILQASRNDQSRKAAFDYLASVPKSIKDIPPNFFALIEKIAAEYFADITLDNQIDLKEYFFLLLNLYPKLKKTYIPQLSNHKEFNSDLVIWVPEHILANASAEEIEHILRTYAQSEHWTNEEIVNAVKKYPQHAKICLLYSHLYQKLTVEEIIQVAQYAGYGKDERETIGILQNVEVFKNGLLKEHAGFKQRIEDILVEKKKVEEVKLQQVVLSASFAQPVAASSSVPVPPPPPISLQAPPPPPPPPMTLQTPPPVGSSISMGLDASKAATLAAITTGGFKLKSSKKVEDSDSQNNKAQNNSNASTKTTEKSSAKENVGLPAPSKSIVQQAQEEAARRKARRGVNDKQEENTSLNKNQGAVHSNLNQNKPSVQLPVSSNKLRQSSNSLPRNLITFKNLIAILDSKKKEKDFINKSIKDADFMQVEMNLSNQMRAVLNALYYKKLNNPTDVTEQDVLQSIEERKNDLEQKSKDKETYPHAGKDYLNYLEALKYLKREEFTKFFAISKERLALITVKFESSNIKRTDSTQLIAERLSPPPIMKQKSAAQQTPENSSLLAPPLIVGALNDEQPRAMPIQDSGKTEGIENVVQDDGINKQQVIGLTPPPPAPPVDSAVTNNSDSKQTLLFAIASFNKAKLRNSLLINNVTDATTPEPSKKDLTNVIANAINARRPYISDDEEESESSSESDAEWRDDFESGHSANSSRSTSPKPGN